MDTSRSTPEHSMTQDEIPQHYAALVDPDSQTSPDPVRRAIIRALETFNLQPPLLDLGTGIGSNLRLLGGAGRAVGVDISVSALGHAKSVAPVAAADGARLPFAPSSFGGAICTEVLEHV